MSERIKNLMDIRELLLHLRAQSSDRQAERDTGINRRTVKRYREWAAQQKLLEGELPGLEELQTLLGESFVEKKPPQNQSSVEKYRRQIETWVREDVEAAAIRQRLMERGYTGSYASVWRFVKSLKPRAGQNTTTRLETKPGEEAQVDFGYAGHLIDTETGKERKAWAFVMVLAWSRHQYVEFVWDQKVETWLRCHRNAFEFFGCVPQRVRIDNLRAAILKAVFDDPQVQYAYRECAEHYSFLIAPCRVATPEHKGKVEQGGVHYVCRNFLGGRTPSRITQANRDVLVWCHTTAGLRIHGTTKEKPLERFQQVEKAVCKPLPSTPYDIAIWKHVKVYRDCYVVFGNAYYSVPNRMYPGKVWICGGSKQVRIFNGQYKCVATHERATKPGQRLTHPEHIPPEKRPGLTQTYDTILVEAEALGPNVLKIVQDLLDDPVLYRLPTAGRLVRLAQRFSPERLEAACKRALVFGDPGYKTIKRILEEKLDEQTVTPPVSLPPATTYARTTDELMGNLVEVVTWS